MEEEDQVVGLEAIAVEDMEVVVTEVEEEEEDEVCTVRKKNNSHTSDRFLQSVLFFDWPAASGCRFRCPTKKMLQSDFLSIFSKIGCLFLDCKSTI